MRVIEFNIEESKVNKAQLILVATTEDGKKFVASGSLHTPTYLVPYEEAWDAIGEQEYRKVHNI